jgi:hypothetical protein
MTTHLHTDLEVIPLSATDKINTYFKSWLRKLDLDELRWLSIILGTPKSSLRKKKKVRISKARLYHLLSLNAENIDTILVALRKVPMIVLSDSIQVSPMTKIREIMDHIIPVRTYEEAYENGEMGQCVFSFFVNQS